MTTRFFLARLEYVETHVRPANCTWRNYIVQETTQALRSRSFSAPCLFFLFVIHHLDVNGMIIRWQDIILPAEKADGLLARLLHASRGWTSRPWYNVNGTPGLTHNRSCVYRIPTARAGTGTCTVSGVDQDQAGPAKTSDKARRCTGSGPAAVSGRGAKSGGGGGGGGGECAWAVGGKSECGDDVTLQSSDEESFYYDFPEAGKVGGGGGGGVAGIAGAGAGAGADPPGGATAAEQAEGAMRWSPPKTEPGDSAGKTWIDDDQGAEVAPEELLEVVPLVVEVVRRYIRWANTCLRAFALVFATTCCMYVRAGRTY